MASMPGFCGEKPVFIFRRLLMQYKNGFFNIYPSSILFRHRACSVCGSTFFHMYMPFRDMRNEQYLFLPLYASSKCLCVLKAEYSYF